MRRFSVPFTNFHCVITLVRRRAISPLIPPRTVDMSAIDGDGTRLQFLNTTFEATRRDQDVKKMALCISGSRDNGTERASRHFEFWQHGLGCALPRRLLRGTHVQRQPGRHGLDAYTLPQQRKCPLAFSPTLKVSKVTTRRHRQLRLQGQSQGQRLWLRQQLDHSQLCCGLHVCGAFC